MLVDQRELTAKQRRSHGFRRAHELKVELKKTKNLGDFHATINSEGVPFVIAEPGKAQRIASHLPEDIEIITDGFDEVEPGGTDYWMNKQPGKVGICVEGGWVGDPRTYTRTRESVDAFLRAVGHNSGVSEKFAKRHVTVIDLRKVQKDSFVYKRPFRDFERVTSETLVGTDGVEEVRVQDTDAGRVDGLEGTPVIIFATGVPHTQPGAEAFLVGVEKPPLQPV